MLIDCPCGNMYPYRDFKSCPQCGKDAKLSLTDEANDHHEHDDEETEDEDE